MRVGFLTLVTRRARYERSSVPFDECLTLRYIVRHQNGDEGHDDASYFSPGCPEASAATQA